MSVPFSSPRVEDQFARMRCLLAAAAYLLAHDSDEDNNLMAAVEIMLDEARTIERALEGVPGLLLIERLVRDDPVSSAPRLADTPSALPHDAIGRLAVTAAALRGGLSLVFQRLWNGALPRVCARAAPIRDRLQTLPDPY